MAQQPQRIDFDQFAGNLQEIIDQVSAENQPVVVERDGETFRLEKQDPDDIWNNYDPEKVRAALKASIGMFAGTDTEAFLKEMHEQREQGPGRFE